MTEDEIRQAEEKFAESLHLAQMGMHNILDNDVTMLLDCATIKLCHPKLFFSPLGGANRSAGLLRRGAFGIPQAVHRYP